MREGGLSAAERSDDSGQEWAWRGMGKGKRGERRREIGLLSVVG